MRSGVKICSSALVFLPLVLAVGCTKTYYKAMSTFGKEKRDILVSRVKDSKKEQQQAKEQIKTTMRNLGVEPAPDTPKAFGDYIRSETTKWRKVIQTAHIKLD